LESEARGLDDICLGSVYSWLLFDSNFNSGEHSWQKLLVSLIMDFYGCSWLWKFPALLPYERLPAKSGSDALHVKNPSARLWIDDISAYASLQDIGNRRAS
jgi:hypothetical protein